MNLGSDVDDGPSGVGTGKTMMSGDKVVMKDLKDHLRHAKKVGECIQVRFFLYVLMVIDG